MIALYKSAFTYLLTSEFFTFSQREMTWKEVKGKRPVSWDTESLFLWTPTPTSGLENFGLRSATPTAALKT